MIYSVQFEITMFDGTVFNTDIGTLEEIMEETGMNEKQADAAIRRLLEMFEKFPELDSMTIKVNAKNVSLNPARIQHIVHNIVEV